MRQRIFLLAAAIASVVLASAFDVPVSRWIESREPLQPKSVLGDRSYQADSLPGEIALDLVREFMRVPGNYVFTLALAGAVAILHRGKWRSAAELLLSGAISGFIVWTMKWMVGRTRPFKGLSSFEFHPFPGGLLGLFKNANLTFPSGDTALAFATAECMARLLPRWRIAMYAGATVVALQRVLVNAHHVSDAVAGALVGILSARLAHYLLERLITNRPSEVALSGARTPV